MKSDHSAKRRLLAGVFVASAVAMIAADHGAAKPPIPQQACDSRDNNTYDKLLECVRRRASVKRAPGGAAGRSPTANGGNRADRHRGYLASLDYVQDTMTAAGWDVSRHEFTYDGINLVAQQIAPTPAVYEPIAAVGDRRGRRHRRNPGRRRHPRTAPRPVDERL